MAPSGWGVREALSYDLPSSVAGASTTRPSGVSNTRLPRRARRVPAAHRRPLVRAVRATPGRASVWRAIADVPDWTMRVYECHPEASRVALLPEVRDRRRRSSIRRLPDRRRRARRASSRTSPREVSVEAALTRPSLLVLRDSYSDDWRVEVDGRPATLVRANSLQRGVPLPPGRHLVRFTYRPRDFLIGLILSSVAIIGIGFTGFAVRGRKNRERTEAEPMNPKNPQNPQNPENPREPGEPGAPPFVPIEASP